MGCGPQGEVDRALSIQSGQLHQLPISGRSPALSDSALYLPGYGGGLVHLLESGPEPALDVATIHTPAIAPTALHGDRVALLSAGSVQSFLVTDRVRHIHDASPVGWYPPALTDTHVAWVDTGGVPSETEIWWMPLDGSADPQRLSASGRHVIGSPAHLAWVTDTHLFQLDLATGVTSSRPIQTGFHSPPALWGAVLCWEHWGATDLDITCDDGLSMSRPGHQQHPSRWGRWLLYREGNLPWLLTAPEPS